MNVYQCVHWLPDGIEFDDRAFLKRQNAAIRLADLNQDREGRSLWELMEIEIVDEQSKRR